MSLLATKSLSFVLGSFFTFAGVSKTSDIHGVETSMSNEMQGGFKSGDWSRIFGLPAMPFLYTVGISEIVSGLVLLGFSTGLVKNSMYAQWAAAGSAFITLNATSAHVVRGDPKEAIGFCTTLCSLFTVLNFAIASSRSKAKGE
jgi:uncharacterized membrane protein YphA (DoxX/SURF4 family)|uniref:DoxX family protein n=1 Tax=Attheya septentrionalis TaxID=420275 RepID=A0A7S2USV9_9STRA|mmetsp:Transcript_7922/g.14281  ORF Transcript_7922/g.14281 Transcript_7922/m.14281 type:complete len:144 (+) Transcript_7922:77-508(+)